MEITEKHRIGLVHKKVELTHLLEKSIKDMHKESNNDALAILEADVWFYEQSIKIIQKAFDYLNDQLSNQ